MRQRVKRLIDRGVMQVVAVTDPAVLGFGLQAMVGITVEGDIRVVAAALAERSTIDYVVVTAGRFDIFAEVVCPDAGRPARPRQRPHPRRPRRRSTEIFTYLNLVKQTYAWGTH